MYSLLTAINPVDPVDRKSGPVDHIMRRNYEHGSQNFCHVSIQIICGFLSYHTEPPCMSWPVHRPSKIHQNAIGYG